MTASKWRYVYAQIDPQDGLPIRPYYASFGAARDALGAASGGVVAQIGVCILEAVPPKHSEHLPDIL